VYGGWQSEPWNGCYFAKGTFDASAHTPYWNRVSVVMAQSGMSFYVNDTLVQTFGSDKWFTGGVLDKSTNFLAPFDQPFYLILNMAVGGNYPAEQTDGLVITDSKHAPYKFLIDWVRVYRLP
ncbi:hypothetical protein Agub_g1884, partial [Astrephomene gubernaculifera]